MKVSPISIKKQEFNKGLRGYDQEEVRAYLEKLADEFDMLQSENEKIKAALESATERLGEFRKIEKNLQDTLLKAQESSSRSIESTKRQTGLIVKEAELKAQQIIEKARESANEIRSAVINLREEKDLIVAKLKSIISSQSRLVEIKYEEGIEIPVVNKMPEYENKIEVDIEGIVDKII